MILWALAFLVSIWIVYNIESEYCYGHTSGLWEWVVEKFWTLSKIIGVFLCATIVVALISIIPSVFCQTEWQQVSEQTIYSIKDNSSISGHFFLGSGSIDGEIKYFCIIKDEIGYKTLSCNSEVARIIEGENNPKLIIQKQQYSNRIIQLIFFNMRFEYNRYVFYIPSNSILFEYKIDLE